jgi:hypothetical protein
MKLVTSQETSCRPEITPHVTGQKVLLRIYFRLHSLASIVRQELCPPGAGVKWSW